MAGPDIRTQVLGETEDILHTEDFAGLEAATDLMVSQARASVRILAQDTDPALYSRPVFVEHLAHLISAHSRVASVRVLVADPRRAQREPHRLVELWHRFPSFVEFRELREPYARQEEAFMIVDETGLVRRPHHGSLAAVVTFRNPSTARDRAAWFDEAWSHAAPCTALRRLSL